VREPHPIKGARASLFERLAISAAGGGVKPVIHDYTSLVAAVMEELERLLNTRCHMRGESAELAAGTVVDYGVPDLTSFSPANESEQRRLADVLAQRIAAYEPRLRDVRVVLAPSDSSPVGMRGRLVASLRSGSIYEPVSLLLAIDRQGARIGAGEAAG